MRGKKVRGSINDAVATHHTTGRSKGRKRTELTSAHDKLGVGAERVSDLVCKINLSCLIVRRCSRVAKTSLKRQ